MIEIPFVFAELIFAMIWLFCRIVVWRKQGRIDWKREAVLLLMFINLAVLLRITFFPMSRVEGKVQPLVFDAATAFPFRINVIPFVHLLEYDIKRELRLNIIGNVTMFIPSGIVLPIIYKELNSFWKVVGAGALLSLSIEILQLPFSVRASDVDDLILNTAGVAIGYAIYALVNKLKKNKGQGTFA